MLVMEKGIDRRDFFKLLTGKRVPARGKKEKPKVVHLRPPGAVDEKVFPSLCNNCGDCEKACPHQSIKMEGRFPIIVPREFPCWLCHDFPCIQACKVGALRPVEAREKVRMGVAVIRVKDCPAWDGGDCRFCIIHCPLSGEAIYLDDFRPVVREERCTGCGVCEYICSTVNDRTPIRVIR